MNKFIILLIIIFSSWQISCKKSGFLDAKPDHKLLEIETLDDLQGILDNTYIINGAAPSKLSSADGVDPQLTLYASDDIYIQDIWFSIFSTSYLNAYIWNDAIEDLESVFSFNWTYPYRAISYANLVLDKLEDLKVGSKNIDSARNIKGGALFTRAKFYYELMQIYAPHYNSATRDKDLGVPLRLTSDINEKIFRPTIEKVYNTIIDDLKLASSLLPDIPVFKTRPSKAATYGLLARLYQTIGQHNNALLYSDSCLRINNKLVNYNTIIDNTTYPFNRFSDEVIYHSIMLSHVLQAQFSNVDSLLYDLYDVNDLRKKLFFIDGSTFGNSKISFRGSYDGSHALFAGISTDEILLIRAESNARLGHVENAMNDLNRLLKNRFVTNTFAYLTASTPKEALRIIVDERRKELLFRGLRWSDLRRLNAEGASITLKRKVNGIIYELKPDDLRYTYLIPQEIMGFNPEMKQNRR
jgi:hypothetical protein